MARPKTKSSLVEGMIELVDSLRSIESKLNMLLKSKNTFVQKRSPGRPTGSVKRKPGRPVGSVKRKPGRPAASKKSKGRGRPPGSKNKK